MRKAWCLYDWANSAFATIVLTALFPVYFSRSVVPQKGICLSNYCIPGPSVWAYAVSVSVLIVALIAPLVGRSADLHGFRKLFFSLFVITGGAVTCLMFFAYPGFVWYALICFLTGHVCFLLADVIYNSYLPLIAPESEHDLLSSQGYAWGYAGGGLLLALQFVALGWAGKNIGDRNYLLIRLCLASVGVWWLLFSIPALLYLPGSVRGFFTGSGKGSRKVPSFGGIFVGPGAIKKNRGALLFLLAYFFYNNGIQTVISMAAVYGSYQLGITQGNLMGALLLTQFVAFPGALFFGYLAGRFGTVPALLFNLVVWCLIVAYAAEMNKSFEFWILATLTGLVLGGSQALSRSAFTRFIPEDRSSEFFGFYAMGGKFSSLFGPFFFGLVFNVTRSMRISVLSVLCFFIAGVFLLWLCSTRYMKKPYLSGS